MLSCDRPGCTGPHYPLVAMMLPTFLDHGRLVGGEIIATRGVLPVKRMEEQGWQRIAASPRVMAALTDAYNRSHRFDWLHTPTFLDDRETHEQMKAATAR